MTLFDQNPESARRVTARSISDPDQRVGRVLKPEALPQRGRQDQPRVRDGVIVVERHRNPVETVR
jgi:hypothetical protein